MLRITLLSTSALAALGLLAGPVAAQCVDGPGPTLTCSPPGETAVSDARDGLVVTVEAGAAISNPAGRAVQLDGDAQTLLNFGLIESEGENDGVRSDGTNLLVENAGTIIGTDRGIRLRNGGGSFTLLNAETGEIFAVNQAVRADNEAQLPDVLVENRGLIVSTDGRAVQSRGPGTIVRNWGTMTGGEEVIEARQDALVENWGTIVIDGLSWDPATRTFTDAGATPDEDGVQFSSGTVRNWGLILSTDDGIDIDEGLIHNFATGVIVSAAPDTIRGSSAVDVDELFQFSDPDLPERRPGALEIINEGYMEGPRAIGTDLDSDSPLTIRNSGTLFGRGGDEEGAIAIDLAPNQGETLIELFGQSVVRGDILFGGASTNTLVLGPFESGAAFEGIVRARDADPARALARAALLGEPEAAGGSTGYDVVFAGLGVGDFLAFLLADDLFRLKLAAGDGSVHFGFLAPTSFALGGALYDPEGFAAYLRASGVAIIPLPGTLPLALAGLAGLALLRRRRAA